MPSTSASAASFGCTCGCCLARRPQAPLAACDAGSRQSGSDLRCGECAGHGLNHVSKAVGVPLIRRLSPALWAYGAEKAYKVVRVAVPELP